MIKYRENQFDLFLDGRKKLISIIPKDLINYGELNTRFVYEFSSYIIRTLKEVKNKNKRNSLIYNVLKNADVIESCKITEKLPIKYKIVTFFIRNNLMKQTIFLYKLVS